MMKKHITSWPAILTMSVIAAQAGVEVVDRPDTSGSNGNYVGNRLPLKPSQFIGLPVGSIEPQGWLREFLKRQRETRQVAA